METTQPVAPAQPPAAEVALNAEQCKYLYQLFDADEKEVRQLERYLLVASAAVFSFLANQMTKVYFDELWYLPAFLTLIAGIRAAAFGRRQKLWLSLLADMEQRWWDSATSSECKISPGWGALYHKSGNYGITVSAVLFYVSLLVLTIVTGWTGARINLKAFVPPAHL